MEPPVDLLPKTTGRVARMGVGAALPEPPWDLAMALGGGPLDLPGLAANLLPDGHLVLRAPTEDEDRRAALLELAAAGFVVRRAVGGWLLARATVHRVHELDAGGEAQIVDLFERSFHHRRGIDHWQWQYRSNPLDSKPRVSVAIDEAGQLVAHYAGYPVLFRRRLAGQASSFFAHQICDTMTAPEVRHVGRGPTSLLARTAAHFYERYCSGQVAFNYGFNVGNIQKFSMRFLRADRVEDVPYWRREARVALPAPPRSWLGRRRYVAGVEDPTTEWDELFERCADAYGCLAFRRLQQLRWRYLERPGFTYWMTAARWRQQLVGWAVFRREGDRLLWGDLLLDPRHPEATGALLEAILEHPVIAGVTSVEGWFTPRPLFVARALEGIGFERQPEPHGLALMCVPFADPDAPRWIRSELYYTMGDGDLF
jgi:hypothetical protein